ncbi:hypothetical protein M3Y94_00868900 [Aphelenchoides besseyi]|nr:hypothetical protein M3Y94_00868900 [Aphelenchoides besseyi]
MCGAPNPPHHDLAELIDHYSRAGLEVDKTKVELTKPAKRPSWLLKNTDVEYSTTKDSKLGAGNFCVVYRGKLRRNGDQINVAVKVCKHTIEERKTQEEIDQEDKARLALIQEGQLMRSVRHANVIKFYGIAFDTLPVKIVMELCCGGSVEKLLHLFTDQISVPERVKIAREAAKGLEYLHSKDIVHRDLAVRNILISSQGVSKLADFGLSAFVGDLTGVSVGKEHLPVRWMAPESVQKSSAVQDQIGRLVLWGRRLRALHEWCEDLRRVACKTDRHSHSQGPNATARRSISTIREESHPEALLDRQHGRSRHNGSGKEGTGANSSGVSDRRDASADGQQDSRRVGTHRARNRNVPRMRSRNTNGAV